MEKEKNRGSLATNTTRRHLVKDGEFIRQHPPMGDTIRDMYDAAASSNKNPWGISDHDRHVREIQSVKCDGGIFAQDHTFQVTKNYRKSLRATAAWDVATGTGEIASAVLARTTQTKDFAHAAQQLMYRTNWKPQVKHSDTWPNKKEHWCLTCPGMEGRLGLFHFQKRIVSTLRKKHVDYFDAVTDLLAALYAHHPSDYEQLLNALKNGTLSRTGKKYSSEEISDMKRSRVFRDRHAKYLRKQIHEKETVVQALDDWFCRHKVTSSDPVNRPAGGRLDPTRLEPLFTSDTKNAVDCCKDKAEHLSDPLPMQDMYDIIPPNPNSTHQLSECLSKRGESKLEAFHDRFAHFANCGMRDSLADNLNLAGTARYNLAIRHKRSLVSVSGNEKRVEKGVLSDPEQRKKVPSGWDRVVPCFNHSELACINQLANAVGCGHPFPHAETLPPDNGERFFSECLTITLPSLHNHKHGECGQCLCDLCSKPVVKAVETTTTTTEMTCECNQQTAIVTVTAPTPNVPTTNTRINNNNVSDGGPRQQASQPNNWRCAAAPQTTTATACGTFPPVPPLIPMNYQLAHCHNHFQQQMMQQMMPCCNKHAEWLTKRLGRPPHHPLCPKRFHCG